MHLALCQLSGVCAHGSKLNPGSVLYCDLAGKEIEKTCAGIYPLQNVFIRKVKILRSPKFDITKLMEVRIEPMTWPLVDQWESHARPCLKLLCQPRQAQACCRCKPHLLNTSRVKLLLSGSNFEQQRNSCYAIAFEFYLPLREKQSPPLFPHKHTHTHISLVMLSLFTDSRCVRAVAWR